MTAPQIIEHAQGLGVTLWRDGDSLAVRGPAGKLSPKALERLRELKPLLLPMLAESPEMVAIGRLPNTPQLAEVGAKIGPDTVPACSNSEPVFAPNNEAQSGNPMRMGFCYAHGGRPGTYERSTPHEALQRGGWRSPERIAQEKLFYRLAVGELIASWEAGKPLHQGSVLADPRRWVELAWGRYAPLWHRAEDTAEPGLRSRLESDRELLFSEALGVILQAAYIESRGA